MTAIENKQRDGLKARAGASLRAFALDCSGSTAIEYAIIAVVIGAGVVGVVSALGGTVAELYTRVLEAFGN